MAEATVTLKLTPQEFDLVREAITHTHEDVLGDASPNVTPDAGERQRHRAKALLLSDLGKKLGT